MRDEDKTKEQLVNELVELRQRISELGTAETERKWAEETLRINHPKGHGRTGSIRTNHFSKPGRRSNRSCSSSIFLLGSSRSVL